jgi:hypothetical protein
MCGALPLYFMWMLLILTPYGTEVTLCSQVWAADKKYSSEMGGLVLH